MFTADMRAGEFQVIANKINQVSSWLHRTTDGFSINGSVYFNLICHFIKAFKTRLVNSLAYSILTAAEQFKSSKGSKSFSRAD